VGLKASSQVFNEAASPQKLCERMYNKAVEILHFCLLTININLEHSNRTGGLTKCKISFASVMEKYESLINWESETENVALMKLTDTSL
jgi:hypothetical protein